MNLFDSVLIANRGEIAVRIIRSAQKFGLRTIAVYSEADADAPHVQLADESVCIGPAPVAQSYLSIANILQAAKTTGAGAIHPGYGFLSENAEFAEACLAANLIFIGPDAAAIRLMGDKAAAKTRMIKANVPCVPGYHLPDQADATLIAAAADIGFPIMVKATAGGGGRGMRLVDTAANLVDALGAARSEALNAFGDGTLILEKAVVAPRHVEIQIFADTLGHVVHLGERDCSVQRRHQKIVEEAPCPVMTPDLRTRMGAAAVEAARSISYHGAGTVEFLLDQQGEFYFLEMNTRLQVEHPVTEMVTGLDLVAMQFQVADGQPLSVTQEDVTFDGHAIEVRLYAEDPENDFLPATGRIARWHVPEGENIRVDSGIAEGQEISPFYDPMIAKIVSWGATRDEARLSLIATLKKTRCFGPPTNLSFLIDILETPTFAQGRATTALIADEFGDGKRSQPAAGTDIFAITAVLEFLAMRDLAQGPGAKIPAELLNWSSAEPVQSFFQLSCKEVTETVTLTTQQADLFTAAVAGESHQIEVLSRRDGQIRLRLDGRQRTILFAATSETERQMREGRQAHTLHLLVPGKGTDDVSGQDGLVVSPMHGVLLEILVRQGDQVEIGDRLAVVEAMKMQHEIRAVVSGQVARIGAVKGTQIAEGELLVEIDPTSGEDT